MEFDDLSARLDALNADFISRSPVTTQTRGGRGEIVAAMDIMGGLVGAGVGALAGGGALSGFLAGIFGTAASGWTYSLLPEVGISMLASVDTTYLVKITSPALCDRLGVDHNGVLQTIQMKRKADFLRTGDAEEVYDAILAEFKALGYDATEVEKDSVKYKALAMQMADIVKFGDPSLLANMVEDINPAMINETEIVESYINTQTRLDPDLVDEYAVNFRDMVVESGISDDSKLALQSAISIGVGSSKLWLVEE